LLSLQAAPVAEHSRSCLGPFDEWNLVLVNFFGHLAFHLERLGVRANFAIMCKEDLTSIQRWLPARACRIQTGRDACVLWPVARAHRCAGIVGAQRLC